MRIRRHLLIPLIVLLIAAVVALIVVLRKQAPPEAARLLPGADGFLYIDLRWIRTFNPHQLPPITRDPEYQKFVDETGFEFERDLEQAAFAVHYPENSGATTFSEPRFSEVFVGKFDSARLTAYLKKLSSSVENYRGFDIYNIPVENRTARVVILSYDSVAVSNHPNPDVIHGILDRSRKLASPFGGPWLLRRYYRDVPLASLAFAILRVKPESGAGALTGFDSWNLLFAKPAVTVISARYLRALHLRAEAFTENANDARSIAEKVSTFLAIFHTAEGSIGAQGTDPDVKQFFSSLKVEQSGDRAILTATVPPGFVQKALAEVPTDLVPQAHSELPESDQAGTSASKPHPKVGSKSGSKTNNR
jgi:hypothetical protein